MEPYVSIIIPVFQVERYLSDCLDSILNWKFSDWEAILIDDGSSDRSGIICDEYVAKDARFKVVHKLNEGVSVARNLGLDMASGEWCWFVDPDDLVDSNTPVDVGLYKDKDILIFDIKIFKDGDAIPYEQEVVSYDFCTNRDEFFSKCISYTHPTHWYRKKFWIKEGTWVIRFTKGIKLGEDLEFMRKCELLATNPVKVNHTNYYYRFRKDSASHRDGIEKLTISDTFKVMNNLYDFCALYNIRPIKGMWKRFTNLATAIPINAIRCHIWKGMLRKKFLHLVFMYGKIGVPLLSSRYIWLAVKMPWLLLLYNRLKK